MLGDQCLKRKADVLRGRSETIKERLAQEIAAMSGLPAAPFDACDQATGRINSQALVRYNNPIVEKTIEGIALEKNDDSVSVAYCRLDGEAHYRPQPILDWIVALFMYR